MIHVHHMKGRPRPGSSAAAEQTLALLRDVTGLPIYGSTEKQLHHAIRSGVLLCAYANALFPSTGADAHKSALENKFLALDNLGKCVRVAKEAGVHEDHLFNAEDVIGGRALNRVHVCLHMMRQIASARDKGRAHPFEAKAEASVRRRGSLTSQDGLPPPPHDLASEEDLRGLATHAGCEIANIEERAITLEQLERLLVLIRERCARGGKWWCLEQPADADEEPSWRERELAPGDVHLDHFLHTVARPATRARNCSTVELLATEPQRAEWAVSLVWAEPVASLVACVRAHASDRCLAPTTALWIDVLAFRRADFVAPLPAQLSDAPFHRAADGAAGLLLVVDAQAEVFARAELGLHVLAALLAPPGFLTDVYTAPHASKPGETGKGGEQEPGEQEQEQQQQPEELEVLRLTDGGLEAQEPWERALAESRFPRALTDAALRFALEATSPRTSARAQDKSDILAAVASAVGVRALDATVRARFLLPTLPARLSLGAGAEELAQLQLDVQALRESRLRRVQLTLGGEAPEDWVASELVPCLPPSVWDLSLCECNSATLAQAVARCVLSAEVGSALTALDLSANMIASPGARALGAALAGNATLTSLELYANELGDPGVSALCEGLETNAALRVLGLQAVGLGDSGTCAIAGALVAESTALQVLVLRGNEIGDEGAYFLAEALKANRGLTELDLFCNAIEERGASALAGALALNATLTSLNLDTNDIGDEGAVALAEALRANASLLELDVGSTRETGATSHLIGERGGQALGEALAVNTALLRLDMGGNHVANKGAIAIAEALRTNQSLIWLALHSNSIGERGANALASALTSENGTLRALDLNCNSMGDLGASSLAEALLVNRALAKINLSGNGIGDEGATALGGALRVNDVLCTLKLGSNAIGVAGVSALAEGLVSNRTLTKLGLGENCFGDEGVDSLASMLAPNRTLTQLFLWHNGITLGVEMQMRTAWVREGRINDNLVT